VKGDRAVGVATALVGGVASGVVFGLVSGLATRVPAGAGFRLRDRAVGLGMTTGLLPAIVVLVAAVALRSCHSRRRSMRTANVSVLGVSGLVIAGTVVDCWRLGTTLATPLMSRPVFQALVRAVAIVPALIAALLAAAGLQSSDGSRTGLDADES
jgi:hypothetical protein